MVKTGGVKTGWPRTGLVMTGMVSLVMSLSACGHRDAVDTVDNWYHQYQGGEIAKQRPPAPGAHGTYPRVGLTPMTSVDLPSAQARQALTDRLTLQRNLSQHLAVADGPLIVAPPPPPPQPKPRPANDDSGSSMSVVAPGQTPPPAQNAPAAGTPAAGTPAKPASAAPPAATSAESNAPASMPGKQAQPAPKQATKKDAPPAAPEAGLPEVTRFAPPPIKPSELPQIGDLPPVAPNFPGFNIPRDAALPDIVPPSYDLTEPHGTLIRFNQASDQMARGQEGAIGKALGGRGPHDIVYVKGFGEITSFRPSEQVLGIKLGLLRARALAQTLILHGVAASDIRISAGALGRGARIDRSPY
ncbi:hypothetical protein C0V97_15955 [Asaia sp. W19]|uniref:hypothetical protein n=1 Tax=unclassified Asaia TaxID=2685023 RepID=UPI000F8D2D81|nr:hypothetical protein [Asaia sp. W19]RUT24567.1 hypothetical protein C0V97_15955 [Asaia sp. W19]